MNGNQTRAVWCVNQDGGAVDDGNCSGNAPPATQGCSVSVTPTSPTPPPSTGSVCTDGGLFACTNAGGSLVCCTNGCDPSNPGGCAAAPSGGESCNPDTEDTCRTPGQSEIVCCPTSRGCAFDENGNAICGGSSSPALSSVSLSTSPSSGPAPLSSSLTASAHTSDNTDTLNYSFFFNCAYNGTSVSEAIQSCGSLPSPTPGSCVSNAIGAKCDGISASSKTVSTVYPAGSFSPKVIVEQSSFPPVSGSATVTAIPPATPPNCTITASPSQILTGSTSRITWTCTNTEPGVACTLGGQVVNPNSSITVSPRVTTQYLLSCVNPGNGNPSPPAQAAVTVTVSKNPGLIEVAP